MRSLRRTLLIWVLGALSLGSVALALVTYASTLEEMNEVFNETLRQTALALADYEHSDVDVERRPGSPSPEDIHARRGDAEIVTLTWSLAGVRRFVSDPRIDIPLARASGLARVRIDGATWYVHTIVESNGIVQAAQRAGARREAAAEAASKLLIPLLLLVILIGFLLAVALRRGLRPLDRSVQDVATRSAASMRAIDMSALPLEIHPLVGAINGLLARLATSFSAQQRFVADAAHELRTPVTALRLQMQLLERASQPQEREAAMADLARGIERAEHLLRQLLHLSRAEPQAPVPRLEAVSLRQLARSVVGTFSKAAEHAGIDIGVDAGDGPDEVLVDGDREMLRVMLNNLVDNALRHTPAGGVVDVEVGRTEAGEPILRVRDTGPGIDAADLPHVFDRFYRAADRTGDAPGREGSGLGLSIVAAILKLHGARIGLRNAGHPTSDRNRGSGLVCEILFRKTGPPGG